MVVSGDGRAGDDSNWGWGSITVDKDGVVAVVSGDGCAGGDDSYWGCGSITIDSVEKEEIR